MYALNGDFAVLPKELSRKEVAEMMGIRPRQLQVYLNLVRLFLPEFEDFTHPGTGELNRFATLTEWHIESLMRVRKRVKKVGFLQTRIELARGEKL